MQKLRTIKLDIPSIDLSATKKIIGGYSELTSESESIYGGELEASYCYSETSDAENTSISDGDEDESAFVDNITVEENSSDCDTSDEYDASDYNADDYGAEDIYETEDVINGAEDNNNEVLTLEQALGFLKGSGIDCILDQNYLNIKSNGYGANGCTRFAGQTLPDGSIAEKDTIIIGDNATIETLLEEMFHIWQGENLYTGTGFPSEATSAMEFMDATFDYIYDVLSSGIGSTSLSEEWITDIQGYFEIDDIGNIIGFDWDLFINSWDISYFEQWRESLPENHPYHNGSAENWGWDWEAAKEWWSEYYSW